MKPGDHVRLTEPARFETFVGTPDEAAAFVDSQNLHRRHLTAEFRRERVREMRAAGMSTREIAKKLGTSQMTIVRDLKNSGDTLDFRRNSG